MVPRLVPEISPLDAFCDVAVVAGVVAGIGDSRSWIVQKQHSRVDISNPSHALCTVQHNSYTYGRSVLSSNLTPFLRTLISGYFHFCEIEMPWRSCKTGENIFDF